MKIKWLTIALLCIATGSAHTQTLHLTATDTCNYGTIIANYNGPDVPLRYGWLSGKTPVQESGYWTTVGERIDKQTSNYIPSGLTMDKEGNLYVIDQTNNRVLKYAPGATTGVVVGGGNGYGSAADQFALPTRIALDEIGNIYVTDAFNSRVQKWIPGATEGITVAGGNGYGNSADQLMFPAGIAIARNGDIYVSDYEANCVKKFTRGSKTGVIVAGGNGNGDAANQLSYPFGVTLDSAGNLFIADSYNHRIQKWAPGSTEGVTVAGGGKIIGSYNNLFSPIDVELGPTENMFVLDNEKNAVLLFKKKGKEVVAIAGGNGETYDKLQRPQDLCLNPLNKNEVYVANWYYATGGVIRYAKTPMPSNSFNPREAGHYRAFVVTKAKNIVFSDNSVMINETPMPVAGIKGKSLYNAGETTKFFADSSSGLDNYYKWTVPADATIISGQGTPVVTVQLGSSLSGFITLQEINTCGSSPVQKKKIQLASRFAINSTATSAMAINKINAGLYPNPASNYAVLQFSTAMAQPYTINIVDATGRILSELKSTSTQGINTKTLNVASYKTGVYMVVLHVAGTTTQVKLLITK